MLSRLAAATLIGIAICATAAGDSLPPVQPVAPPNPLRFGSLPFDPICAELPAKGTWFLTASMSWFNLWYAEGETTSIRHELGLDREVPVTSRELRELELRYTDEAMAHVDLEGTVLDVVAAVGLGHRVALAVRLPWVSMGPPHWDAIPEEWHNLFGLTQSNRDAFPRGETLLYIEGTGATIERSDLTGAGLGDTSVSLTVGVGSWIGADHRLVGALELPTGDPDTLRGSGGFDLGVRWFGQWRWRRNRLLAGAGYSRLDRDGDLLGVERTDTWHLATTYNLRLGASTAALLAAAYESSPLAGFSSSVAGAPGFTWTAGISWRLHDETWMSFQYGADRGRAGVAPDVSLRVVVSSTLRPPT